MQLGQDVQPYAVAAGERFSRVVHRLCVLGLTESCYRLPQYAMLADFLAQHGFAPPASREPAAEAAMPAAAVDECRAIVAGVMAACRRLTIAEGTDADELLDTNFQQ